VAIHNYFFLSDLCGSAVKIIFQKVNLLKILKFPAASYEESGHKAFSILPGEKDTKDI
jgi:hypothetical protein